MKNLILSVVLFLGAFAQAGTLTDAANVFGALPPETSAAVEQSPVWVETLKTAPDGRLKDYADAKATKLDRGFMVVITTQPTSWRISMNPPGLVSSEDVRRAGDKMAAAFKQGHFQQGLANLVADLNALAASVPAEFVEASEREYSLWVGFGLAVVIVVVIAYPLLICVQSRFKNESQPRVRPTYGYTPVAASHRGPLPPRPMPVPIPRASARQTNSAAERVFNCYTPEQRQALCDRHRDTANYSPGAVSDPLLFYMLMSSIDGESSRHTTAERQTTSSPSSCDSVYSSPSDSSSSYSSDSSSSSSYDSGSSSSDSSGAGGSW